MLEIKFLNGNVYEKIAIHMVFSVFFSKSYLKSLEAMSNVQKQFHIEK